MDRAERSYRKLVDLLGPVDSWPEHECIENPPFMDLVVEVLERRSGFVQVSLRHDYEQNGDLMADPDMEVRVYPARETAHAVHYQQDGLGIYWPSFVAGRRTPKHRENQAFLEQWLARLTRQGFARREVA